jgi:hypothetical protein
MTLYPRRLYTSSHIMLMSLFNLCLFRHGSGGYLTGGGLVTTSGIGSGNMHYMQQYATLGNEMENHRPKLEMVLTPTSASTLPGYWMRHDYGPYVEVDSGMRLTSAPMSRYPVSQAPAHAQSRWNQERRRWEHDRFVFLISYSCVYATLILIQLDVSLGIITSLQSTC